MAYKRCAIFTESLPGVSTGPTLRGRLDCGCTVHTRDEYILGIPMGPVGMGIAKLVSWEWKWQWQCLDRNDKE